MAWLGLLGKRRRGADDEGEGDGCLPPNLRAQKHLNSSRQDPELMARVNHDTRYASGGGNILQLPNCVLRHIFHEVLVLNRDIKVTTDGMDLSSSVVDENGRQILKPKHEIALLRTCQQIRQLAVPIFYFANSFTLHITDFNAAAIQNWWSRTRSFHADAERLPLNIIAVPETFECEDWIGWFQTATEIHETLTEAYPSKDERELWMGLKRAAAFDVSPILPGFIHFELSNAVPHWDNLKEWIRLWHSGLLPGYSGSFLPPSLTDKHLRAVYHVFNTLEGQKDEPWPTIEKLLPGIRDYLKDNDDRWEVVDGSPPDQSGGNDERRVAPGCARPIVEGSPRSEAADEEMGDDNAGDEFGHHNAAEALPSPRDADADDDDDDSLPDAVSARAPPQSMEYPVAGSSLTKGRAHVPQARRHHVKGQSRHGPPVSSRRTPIALGDSDEDFE
ncbi:Hypothetical predicted protein [Lecanosticta acicola]|uniref:Uncharacterized protein n=1 Tax=Lecanosticta acicola TaxID=111012 RepID=A0AAI9EAQ0_9PEZI|nr:Hypothetical predicted protein [Lecanosticta acicola]